MLRRPIPEPLVAFGVPKIKDPIASGGKQSRV